MKSGATNGEPCLVLIADDDVEMRRMLAAALRRDGYEVAEAPHGAAVLTHLAKTLAGSRTRKPDLIVTDVRMPGISGLEILSGLRANGWTIPIILITAFGDTEVHVNGRSLGATDVVDKPFDLAFFRHLVRLRLDAGGLQPETLS